MNFHNVTSVHHPVSCHRDVLEVSVDYPVSYRITDVMKNNACTYLPCRGPLNIVLSAPGSMTYTQPRKSANL
jgi:hypothetical protein